MEFTLLWGCGNAATALLDYLCIKKVNRVSGPLWFSLLHGVHVPMGHSPVCSGTRWDQGTPSSSADELCEAS